MGKIKNIATNGIKVVTSVVIGGTLLELGNIGGQAMCDDVRYVIGKEPHPVIKTGKFLPKYYDINPYTGERTRVKYNKKQNNWVPVK